MNQPTRRNNARLAPAVTAVLRALDPVDRPEYLRRLRAAGWTISALTDAADTTRSRVRRWLEQPADPAALQRVAALHAPDAPEPVQRVGRPRQDPAPGDLTRLRDLQGRAQLVRSHTRRNRLEAEEYTALLARLVDSGVTVYRLSRELGVTHNAIRSRLIRYGYRPAPAGATQAFYRPVLDENRA